ncbi:MAG: helix-turn-helix domain-containing protein [Pseudomonadota bacterium]
MKSQQKLLIEPAETSPSTIHISGKCNYREEGDLRIIFANGIPLLHYAREDKTANQYAMIHLVETGLASQHEVAEAFNCCRLTISRAKNKYNEGGMVALMPKRRGPKDGSKVNKAKTRRILGLKEQGFTNVAIGSRLGLKEDTVRKALKRMGWSQPKTAEQIDLAVELKLSKIDPVDASPSELIAPEINEPPVIETNAERHEIVKDLSDLEQVSYDPDPSNRVVDRSLARLGLLQDAVPVFRSGSNISCVGVLICIPALIESGVLTAARKIYGGLGASFYGLRTILVTLLLMALLRIKRPEGLKEQSAVDLGRILGLDRICEVKTLRRKLDRLAAKDKAFIFGQQLAKTRIQRREGTLGYLYVDGHVRVYNGKRKLAKAYVTKKRLAMPATTDYWVNDQQGDPIFVVTAPANEGLVKMLPSILQEAKSLIGENRPLTVVFDRGGWSPKLFSKLIKQGIDIITYRKGKTALIPEDHFYQISEEIEGKKIEYRLHDRSVAFLKGKLWLRQVSRLNPSGHQTHVITSRQDLSAVTIAYRMFERWRQENYFKYMTEEYALDALVDYDIEEDDLQRLVPNPKRKEINRERNKIKAEINELGQEYGLKALSNKEMERPTMRGFKIANSTIGRKIEELKHRELELKALYERMPARVPLKDTLDNQTAYRLRREKKHLTDLIKMVAYQAETDLLSLIRGEYARADDEGRTLIQSALKSSGDIEVNGNELRITLNPLSSLHRSKAIKVLCEKLNTTNTIFPGTKLRLVYDVKEHGHVT